MQNIFDKEYTVIKEKLLCPSCFDEVGIETILEGSTFSWPYHNWIQFKCPACQNKFHVKVSNQLIETGALDGAPGPCFFVCSRVVADDFFVDIKVSGITCRYQNKVYRFPAYTSPK